MMSLFRFGFKPVGDRTEADTNISSSVVGGDAGTSDVSSYLCANFEDGSLNH